MPPMTPAINANDDDDDAGATRNICCVVIEVAIDGVNDGDGDGDDGNSIDDESVLIDSSSVDSCNGGR